MTDPAPVPLDSAYWLDGRGGAHRATGQMGAISRGEAAKRTRILSPGQAKAAGVPFGTPADHPRCVPHDPHATRAPETPGPVRPDPAPDPKPDPKPPGPAAPIPPDPLGDGGGASIRHLPRKPYDPPRVDTSKPLEREPIDVGDTRPGPDEEPDEVFGTEPGDAGASAGGEPHPDCPRCDDQTVLCPGCGKRFVKVTDEEAEKAAGLVIVGIATGIARGQGHEGPLHVPLDRDQIVAAGAVVKPWLQRAGGVVPWARTLANAGSLIMVATATALGTHAVGRCEGCRAHAEAAE